MNLLTAIAGLFRSFLVSATYLEVKVAGTKGGAHSPYSPDQVDDRHSARPRKRYGLLGRRLAGFRREGDAKGRKVFLVMYRLAGAGSRLRKYTIGPYGRVTLPMAKAQAQKIFAARLDGRDPAEEKRQSRRRLVIDRVDDLVETFIREHVAKIGTSRRITSLLRRDVIPYWGAKSVHEIKKRDVSDLISLIAQRNAHASHRLLKTLKTFFRWCVGRAVIDFSPAEGISSPYREVSRDRVLTDQELAAVILSARRMPPPYGSDRRIPGTDRSEAGRGRSAQMGRAR